MPLSACERSLREAPDATFDRPLRVHNYVPAHAIDAEGFTFRPTRERGALYGACAVRLFDARDGSEVLALSAEAGTGATNGLACFETPRSPVNVAAAHDTCVVVFLLDAWPPPLPADEAPPPAPAPEHPRDFQERNGGCAIS